MGRSKIDRVVQVGSRELCLQLEEMLPDLTEIAPDLSQVFRNLFLRVGWDEVLKFKWGRSGGNGARGVSLSGV